MKNIFQENRYFNILITLSVGVVVYQACNEFHDIAWGTGAWWKEFSRTWAVLYFLFVAFSASFLVFMAILVWNNNFFILVKDSTIAIRTKLGNLRWLLWLVVFIAPVWFFQYTLWGYVFQKLYIRIFIWIIVVCLLTIISSRRDQLAGWNEFLASLILTASAFSIAISLKDVNGYPFSLGWSEGNRLWDYSILFGSDLYIYPAEREIPVLLDFGRRLVGGLPFIFPGITITVARLWVGLVQVIPYFLLGLALFRFTAKNKLSWLLLTLWTFLFLKQGPIHPPLVLGAALVALAWRVPLWFAIPLVVGAGYFVETSRFTWIFAPGIWIFMLEFSSASFASPADRKVVSAVWKRSITLGVLGIFGGFVLPNLLGSAGMLISYPASMAATPVATAIAQAPAVTATPAPVATVEALSPTFFDRVVNIITIQPLLWYRLLPNSTYDNGILLSLLLAIMPLVITLIYLSTKRLWFLGKLQKLAIILPLLAFLAVGLVASTKIGGGGDLHNMDMFLIGLLFTGVIAWQNGGSAWIQDSKASSSLMKIVVVALLINSSFGPLLEMRSYSSGEDIVWLLTLTDVPDEKSLEMLPSQQVIDTALETIGDEVSLAKEQGDVLFIDQRQLLTFGYIVDVPFVPEYEKKVLMNHALSANAAYFESFYEDLAAHRFSLIVSEPLRTPIKDSSYQFGEENNDWVKWVSSPVLCYYEEKETLKEVGVQLLVPRSEPVDCSAQLP